FQSVAFLHRVRAATAAVARQSSRSHRVLAVDDTARRLREDARRARGACRFGRSRPRLPSTADLATRGRAARGPRIQLLVCDRRLLAPVRDRRGGVEADDRDRRAGLQAGDEIQTIAGQRVLTLEDATLGFLNELVGDGRIELTVRGRTDDVRDVELDVRGRARELTQSPALFDRLGIRPGAPALVGTVDAGSAAEQAGIMPGDLFVRVDDQSIGGWQEWV